MSDFDARMAQLRARFLDRAAAERAQLVEAMAADDAAEIRRIAHSLSGAGGVFGFPAISASAQQVEETLDGPPDPAALDRLCRALLDALDAVLQAP
ncbi:MAG: Hpt domain-containing protein [Allosphingosinicella sp.]